MSPPPDPLQEAVARLRALVTESGCEDGVVAIRRTPDAPRCLYERGAVIQAEFGGRTGAVCTQDPVQATTRISFMFDAVMDSPQKRSAALAIVNVVSAFFCLARKVHACPPECREVCLRELAGELRGKRVHAAGDLPGRDRATGITWVEKAEDADVVLVHAATLLRAGEGPGSDGPPREIFLGPSAAGVASLLNRSHWCPYGT
ncbi:MAG: hypothetical protein LUQ41_04550 [Methanomicrobiales archaeon]|nr:hypothetical protein [Methanomicrobiales archaeon]